MKERCFREASKVGKSSAIQIRTLLVADFSRCALIFVIKYRFVVYFIQKAFIDAEND